MSIPSVYAPSVPNPNVAGALTATDGEPWARVRLTDLIGIARRRRTLILSIASGVIAATLIALLVLPQRYVATATVVLEGRKNNVAEQSAVLGALPTDPASLQNQVGILMSRDLAARVIDKLHLDRDSELSPASGWFGSTALTAAEREHAHNVVIDNFISRLNVDVIGLSSTLSVSFSSTDPEKAARIANAIVDEYAAAQVRAKVDAAQAATGWLTERIRQLGAQVADAEGAVQRYKVVHNLADAPDGTSLVDQQMLAINTQLAQARADLAQKEANYAHIHALVQSGQAADASQVVASPLIVQLRQQEADLMRQEAQLATRYGPRHPKMLEMESQRHDLQAKIAEEVRRVGASLASDVAAAKAQVVSLQASLANVQKDSEGQGTERIELKSLQANVASTRTMYESFVTRLREAQNQADYQTPDARIVSRATTPTQPAPPRRSLIFAASVPAALLLGLLIALLIERFTPALAVTRIQAQAPMTTAAAETASGVPVLAEFPDLAKLSASPIPAADYVIDYPASGFARAIAALDRQIATAGWQAPKVLAVTSAEASPERTAISLALARAAAQRGQRVLLIDGDTASAAILAMAHAQRPKGGLAEVVAGAAPLSKSVTRDARSNVMLLPWRTRPARAADLLSSLRMRQLVAYLRSTCDLVVIDTPAVLSAEGATLVAYADAVLLVAASGEKGQILAARGLARLSAMQAPTAGIALVG